MSHLDPMDFDAPGFGDVYDELPLWSAPFGLWILARVPLGPELTYLDIGAGTGFLSIELAERCGPACRVIAVDPWAAAMARLRRKLAARPLPQIRLLEQDAATLDLPECSVDVMVSNLGVNNFPNAASVLTACWRVAKPGATLLLTTNLVGHMAEFYEVYRQVLQQTGQADRLAALDAHIQHRATPDSLRQMLDGAGFQVRELATDAFTWRFADGSALLRHHFIRLGFLQAWLQIATPGREESTLAALEAALNDWAAQRGELCLTVPTAGVVAQKPASDTGS